MLEVHKDLHISQVFIDIIDFYIKIMYLLEW